MTRMPFRFAARAVVLAAAALTAAPGHAARPLMDFTSPVKDLTLTSKVEQRDMDALKQISNEFAQSYRFASSTMYMKEPDKFRVDSKAGVVHVRYVINGNAKVLKAGIINKRWDIANEPGQRQGGLTVGLLTPSFVNLVDATPKGTRTISGRTAEVFDTRFKGKGRSSWHRLFMDPDQRYILRVEQYKPDNSLKDTIVFSDPKKVNGIWIPTRTKVFNPKGQLGAVTRMENIRVDSGLSDSLFSL